MVKINLLPHREEKRKQRQKDFSMMLVFGAVVGALIILVVGMFFSSQLSDQEQRNTYIRTENTRLDKQIKEVVSLKNEIDSLKARQQAVEGLQADRNQPVYLMDELAQQTPEGVYLQSFKQDGQHVLLKGYAQSNERVSQFLRNLGNNSPWLERPDLIEIRAANQGKGKGARDIFTFTINVGIKRPRDQDKSAAASQKP